MARKAIARVLQKALLDANDWRTVGQLEGLALRKVAPELLIRFRAYRLATMGTPKRSPKTPKTVDLDYLHNVGARGLVSQAIHEWERNGSVERRWKGAKGVKNSVPDAWECRITPKGIDRWTKRKEANSENSGRDR